MKVRFRKSFKAAPGVKVNLNKKSAGMTFGCKGVHCTVNTKGQRTESIGIPGTGVYITETTSSGKKVKVRVKNEVSAPKTNLTTNKEENVTNESGDRKSSIITALFIIILASIIISGINDKSNKTNGKLITRASTAATSSTNEAVATDTANKSAISPSASEVTAQLTATETTTEYSKTEAPASTTASAEASTEASSSAFTSQATASETTTKEVTAQTTTNRETTTKHIASTHESSESVFITNTGEKYHKADCRYLKSVIEVSLDDALAKGLSPCSSCFG